MEGVKEKCVHNYYHNLINNHFAADVVERVLIHRNRTLSLLDPHSWVDYTQGACIPAVDLLNGIQPHNTYDLSLSVGIGFT